MNTQRELPRLAKPSLDDGGFVCADGVKLPMRYIPQRHTFQLVDKDRRTSKSRGSRYIEVLVEDIARIGTNEVGRMIRRSLPQDAISNNREDKMSIVEKIRKAMQSPILPAKRSAKKARRIVEVYYAPSKSARELLAADYSPEGALRARRLQAAQHKRAARFAQMSGSEIVEHTLKQLGIGY